MLTEAVYEEGKAASFTESFCLFPLFISVFTVLTAALTEVGIVTKP